MIHHPDKMIPMCTNKLFCAKRLSILGRLFQRSMVSILAIFSFHSIFAQATLPAALPTTEMVNYMRTWTARAPETNTANFVLRPVTDVQTVTRYFDGLGRPMETIVKQGALKTDPAAPTSYASATDMVTALTYDAFGKESYKYLPFASNTLASASDITNDGSFKLDAFQQQADYYNSLLAGQPGETGWAYGKNIFEAGPLGRLNATYDPGVSWVGSEATAHPHPTQHAYVLNTATDNVQKWTIAAAQGSLPVNAGAYAAGTLFKTIETDPKGAQVVTFRDEDGQIVLIKKELSSTDPGTGSAHAGWFCNYYIIDDYGNLRFILTPKAVQAIDGTWTVSQAMADQLCYRMEYDANNRLIIKKTPGNGELWMIYDIRDRPILIQDANLRSQSQWLFIKYDPLNRPVMMGYNPDATNTTLALKLAAVAAANLGMYEQRTTTAPGYTLTQSYPVATAANVLTINYYDDYSWASLYGTQLAAKNNSFDGQFAPVSNSIPYPQTLAQAGSARSRPTGGWSKVLGNFAGAVTGIAHAQFYDARGRMIQLQTINITGGTDVTTVQYDWSGNTLKTFTAHVKSGANAQNYSVSSNFAYDPLGRLLTVTKGFTGVVAGVTTTAAAQVVFSNQYDAMGHTTKKTLGSSMESLSYDYNVRGWLIGTNRNYLRGTATNYFAEEVAYDNGVAAAAGTAYVSPAFNGTIAGVIWKSRGDGINRKYDYYYDGAERLTGAAFLQNTTGSAWDHTLLDFTESNLAYDANGNILTMKKNGYLIGSSGAIDNLTYGYPANSNQLQYVVDASNNPLTTLGDFRTASSDPQLSIKNTYASNTAAVNATIVDYGYDANGNLTSDKNKAITPVTYNYLNQPLVVSVAGKGTVSYTYDATGAKLAKIVVETAKALTTTTTYIGPFVYKSVVHNPTVAGDYTNVFQYMVQEEGRIRPVTPTTINGSKHYAYDYFIKDHLQDTRMVLTDEKQQDINIPAATMEDGVAGTILKYYSVANSARITANASLPGGFTTNYGPNYYANNNGITNPDTDPAVNVTSTGHSGFMYKLPANSPVSTDLGITIKVTSGDVISLWAKSYYFTNGASSTNSNLLTSAVNGFVSSLTGAGAGSLSSVTHTSATTALETINNPLNTALLGALNHLPAPISTSLPRAGLNWILFDNQLNAVASNSSGVPASQYGSGVLGSMTASVSISKSGYLYVFASNESANIDVYFDNIQIVNTRGPIVEETHYYPFGQSIAAISNVSQNKPETPYKFNQQSELQHGEFSDGSGLELYATNYRMYDPQIGRFHASDPLDIKRHEESPYAFVSNNPVSMSDHSGLDQTVDGPSLNGDDNGDDGSGNICAGCLSVVTVYPESKYEQPVGYNAAFPGGISGSTDGISAGDGAPPVTMNYIYDPTSQTIRYGPTASVPRGGLIVYQYSLTTANGTTTWYAANGAALESSTDNPHFDNMQNVDFILKIPAKTYDKVGTAVGLGADFHGAIIGSAANAVKDASKALAPLSRGGTIIGTIVGGVPAAIHIYQQLRAGYEPHWQDVLALTLSIAGIAAEASGVGGLAITGISLVFDVVEAAQH